MTDLKFVSFGSRINPDFWFHYSRIKLDTLKLDSNPFPVIGRVEMNKAVQIPPILDVDRFSFQTNSLENDETSFSLPGIMINKNTVEDFKKCDKSAILEEVYGSSLRRSIQDGSALKSPETTLCPFLLLTYGDLKKYNYYYWFAFPAFQLPTELKIDVVGSVTPDIKTDLLYFAVLRDGRVVTLDNITGEIDYFGYRDPCTFEEHPGWGLRNFLALILYSFKEISRDFRVLSLRRKSVESKMFKFVFPTDVVSFTLGSVLGWEKNEKGKMGPRLSSMKSSMDPKSLAESSVDLNLKLMKWRLVPDLDLDVISNSKILLLGSGTLGCNVARCCLGWGIRHITFVDNSKVSFSNPVRQSLFEFTDCLDGGRPKAKSASEKLKQIFPGVKSEWHDFSIPMPGHRIGPSFMDQTRKDFDLLTRLIKDHDVIFLLMDSRESRWLPTVLCGLYEKLVINAALGFDSFLVMRHGMKAKNNNNNISSQIGNDDIVSGDRLGCYFCNDIVAPGDSLKDRTLDQQCTVTRSGVSYQAASLAVELMTSVLQHPMRGYAGASIRSSSHPSLSGRLGSVPHSIRGSLNTFSQFTPTTPAFDRCTACSSAVLDRFDFDFLIRVCESPTVLEDVTGLTELMSKMDDVLVLSDEDSSE